MGNLREGLNNIDLLFLWQNRQFFGKDETISWSSRFICLDWTILSIHLFWKAESLVLNPLTWFELSSMFPSKNTIINFNRNWKVNLLQWELALHVLFQSGFEDLLVNWRKSYTPGR